MKTAEALAKTLYLDITDDNGNIRMSAQKQIETFLESQLLDAHKAGMTEAANMRIEIGINHHNYLREAILSARDKKAKI